MKNNYKLLIKINLKEILIITINIDERDNPKLIDKSSVTIISSAHENIFNNKDEITDLIKKKILLIEQKINFTFKDTVVILNNFDVFCLSLTGFKKFNGTQISKENITYILNSLKSIVDKHEDKKKILHIFNTKFLLDKKKIENLPIGLFGDFYAHELSFNLINKNDYKNLKNIFDNCNLKINKILLDSFVTGSLISDKYSDVDTFFNIQINEEHSKIFYIENNSIKFEQKFKFGSNIILKDISKITALNYDIVKDIIKCTPNIHEVLETDILEKKFFNGQQFRKIKKKLIFTIAEARIEELMDLFILKNINFLKFKEKVQSVYLSIIDKSQMQCLGETYKNKLSDKNRFEIKIHQKPNIDEIAEAALRITQFGWQKEAIPVTNKPRSLIAKIFQTIFD